MFPQDAFSFCCCCCCCIVLTHLWLPCKSVQTFLSFNRPKIIKIAFKKKKFILTIRPASEVNEMHKSFLFHFSLPILSRVNLLNYMYKRTSTWQFWKVTKCLFDKVTTKVELNFQRHSTVIDGSENEFTCYWRHINYNLLKFVFWNHCAFQ